MYLSWTQYISWFRYGYEAMFIVQWDSINNISILFGHTLTIVMLSFLELDKITFNLIYVHRQYLFLVSRVQ